MKTNLEKRAKRQEALERKKLESASTITRKESRAKEQKVKPPETLPLEKEYTGPVSIGRNNYIYDSIKDTKPSIGQQLLNEKVSAGELTEIPNENSEWDNYEDDQRTEIQKIKNESHPTAYKRHEQPLWGKFKKWLSGENPAMSSALTESDKPGDAWKKERTSISRTKKQNWFGGFLAKEKAKEINRTEINDFKDKQNQEEIDRMLDSNVAKEESIIDGINTEFQKPKVELPQLSEEMKSWQKHLTSGNLDELTPQIEDYEDFVTSDQETSGEIPEDEDYLDDSQEDLVGNEDFVDGQDDLAVKIDTQLATSIKKTGRAPRGKIKGFKDRRGFLEN